MAGQNDIRAGRAFVEVFTDDSRLKQGLMAINKEMDAWASRFTSLGMRAMAAAGAVSVPFAAGIKIFASFGDQIEKMTYRTGMSSETLSELSYVADICGTSIKSIEIAIKGMQKTLSGAADESGSAESKLAKLGLVLADLAGKTPEEQFLTLLERLRQIKDENIRAATALSIFGKSGTQLLPMVEAGAEEIANLREEARKLGVSLSQDDAKSAAMLTDDLGRLTTAFKGLSLAIGAAVAPAVRTVTQFFFENIAAVTAWLRENKEMVVLASTSVLALGTVGGALLGLGATLKFASFSVAGLAIVFGFLHQSIFVPIRLLGYFTTQATFMAAQLAKSTGAVFASIRSLRIFTQFATSAGVAAGFMAEKLAIGLFNSAAALPNLFSQIQRTATASITAIIKTLGKLAGPNTIAQGFNSLLLVFSALPTIARNHAGKAAVLIKNAFLSGLASVRTGWATIASVAGTAWAQTVALSRTAVGAIVTGASIGFTSIVASLKAITTAARGLTVMAAIQKTWNGAIFVTQALLRRLRAGLVAVFSVNVAGLLSQGIASLAMQLSALATTTIPAVVSGIVSGLGGVMPVILAIGAVVGAGAAIWYTWGDAIKSALNSALEAAASFFSWIDTGLQTLYSDVSSNIGLIAGLLSSGDVTGAARVLWQLVQLEFAKGSLAVSQQFGSWLDSLYATMNSWSTNISNVIAYATYYFKLAWAETVAWFQAIWSTASKFFLGIWGTVVTGFGAVWGNIKGYVQPVFDWIVAAWNFVVDTMIAAGDLLWNAIVNVFKSVFGWIKKFTDWVGLTGGEEEQQRKDELAAKRQSAREELDRKITDNESERKSKDDYEKLRSQRDAETQAKIAALESDLEKAQIDFDRASEDQKNAAFGMAGGKEFSDADYAVARAQKRVLGARFEVETATNAGDSDALDRAKKELSQAKTELAQAQFDKVASELETARKDFDAAVARYETAKQSGDEKEISLSKSLLANASMRMDEASGNYERNVGDAKKIEIDDKTLELDFDVAKAQKKLAELTINLDVAKQSGDKKTVDQTKTEIETAKDELAQAEYARIVNELHNATTAFDEASQNFLKAKDSGDMLETAKSQESLEKAAKRLEDANGSYAAHVSKMEKGTKDADKISSVGTFNPFAIQGLSGGGTMERVARASEETSKNTRQLVKQSKQNVALTFG